MPDWLLEIDMLLETEQTLWAACAAIIIMVGIFIYKSRDSQRPLPSLPNTPPLAPLTAEDYLQSATQALNEQEFVRAETLAREGIKLQTGAARTRSSLHNLLGSILATQKKKKEAIEQFQNAIVIDPDFSYPHSNMGNIYFMEKNFSHAETAYLEAIRINPNHADAYSNLGILYKAQKKFDSAIQNFQKAVKLNPECKEAQENLSALQKAQRN
jgi:tetratricopeptide (TPR) repeat protein